jgi:indole-3-glycerol phosphate synthase
MNILDTIVAYKKKEVEQRKAAFNVSKLEQSHFFSRPVFSMKASLLDQSLTGIITEFKRKSPSKGIINANADVSKITKAYKDNGASGISVLTDSNFFGGSFEDFDKARENAIPLLEKDFIVDEYQVIEAKAKGADLILLIAACLTSGETKRLASLARIIGLEVLLELHSPDELDHICEEVELIGINNRNLKTFEVDIEQSLRMAERIPSGKLKIAESGISKVENIQLFKKHGFSGFLIGENFMKENDPGEAFKKFVSELKESVSI